MNTKALILFSLLSLLTGCSALTLPSKMETKTAESPSTLSVYLSHYNDVNTKGESSKYLQVNAQFTTTKSKALVFRVLSDLPLTLQWFEYLEKIESLALYDNNNFLIRSEINSPWPFQNREIITCVQTEFAEQTTYINLSSCTDRHPKTSRLVRVEQAISQWKITSVEQGKVNVSYSAWLDPNGPIPAFFYNRQLKNATIKSISKLQDIIENRSISQYSY